MNLTMLIAKHLKEVYFGGNWTASSLKDNLTDVTWQQATTQVYSFNTCLSYKLLCKCSSKGIARRALKC